MKPTISLHQFNERERLSALLAFLQQGESIALVSDAGTPLISDPGFYLVKAAREQGIAVVPIPGPCAAITALSAAGLPTDKFIFEGFLPAKSKARLTRLSALAFESRTLIFYEAPHRLLETLTDMQSAYGANRQVVIARELTKIHETIYDGTLSNLLTHFTTHTEQLRGEVVILLAGSAAEEIKKHEIDPEKVLALLLNELPLKQAVSLASQITGERKNILYEQALARKKE